jgi:hypothetical protein
MKFLNFFLPLCVIFALPDPKHSFFVNTSIHQPGFTEHILLVFHLKVNSLNTIVRSSSLLEVWEAQLHFTNALF